jgi:hypothetical protein
MDIASLIQSYDDSESKSPAVIDPPSDNSQREMYKSKVADRKGYNRLTPLRLNSINSSSLHHKAPSAEHNWTPTAQNQQLISPSNSQLFHTIKQYHHHHLLHPPSVALSHWQDSNRYACHLCDKRFPTPSARIIHVCASIRGRNRSVVGIANEGLPPVAIERTMKRGSTSENMVGLLTNCQKTC